MTTADDNQMDHRESSCSTRHAAWFAIDIAGRYGRSIFDYRVAAVLAAGLATIASSALAAQDYAATSSDVLTEPSPELSGLTVPAACGVIAVRRVIGGRPEPLR